MTVVRTTYTVDKRITHRHVSNEECRAFDYRLTRFNDIATPCYSKGLYLEERQVFAPSVFLVKNQLP